MLIDLDLHFGDISLMLNKHLEKNILDFVDDGGDVDQLNQYLYRYLENLDVLFAPLAPKAQNIFQRQPLKIL